MAELKDVDLGDARRERRLCRIVEAFAASPTKSFPSLLKDAAELEAFYRFVNNDHFTFEDLTDPHARMTAGRIANVRSPVVVVHDATEFTFSFDDGLREGCEQTGNVTQGFYGSVSLAIAAETGRPLGTLACSHWVKADLEPKNPHQIAEPERKGHGCGRISGARWEEMAVASEKHVSDPSQLIHVIDSEADGVPLFSSLIASGRRFVVRVSGRRLVTAAGISDELMHLSEAAARAKVLHKIKVPLSRRRRSRPSPGKRNAARKARVAKLAFSGMTVTVRGTPAGTSSPPTIALNMVCVREVDPPKKAEPVEWLLATTEPIDSPDALVRVVDYYRARWKVEEFFRALKTGCAFERRQLESKKALLAVLAMSLVIAWYSMFLRHVSRNEPNARATEVLSPLMLLVLRRSTRVPLSADPTANEALHAVAALGGHLKNNGRPGILTITRGMERLLERVSGIVAMQADLGLAEIR